MGNGFANAVAGQAIMAAGARCYFGNRVVMIKMSGAPGHAGRVAQLALIRRHHMSDGFARGLHPVMALGATIHDARMVENANLPRHRAVALCAIIGGTDVIERLASGAGIVMAGCAWLMRGFMVKAGHTPGCCDVAGFASVDGLDMQIVLADGRLIVVAGKAAALDLGMIHMHLRKLFGVVAIHTG